MFSHYSMKSLESSLKNNQGRYKQEEFKIMKNEIMLLSSLMTRRRINEKEVYQIQESLLLKIQIEGRNFFTSTAKIVTRKETMLDISPRRTMDHTTILEATKIGSIIKEGEINGGMIIMEDMKKEEEMLQVIMKKIIVHKRSQNSLGMKKCCKSI